MKNKLGFLIKEGLKKKICTKWFKVVNILLLILIPLLANIDSVIKSFGGDFSTPTNIYVIDETNETYDLFVKYYNESGLSLSQTEVNFEETDKTKEQLSETIKTDKTKDIIINITPSENTYDVEVISYEYIDTIFYQSVVSALNNVKVNIALLHSDIDQQKLADIYTSPQISRVLLNKDLDEDKELLSTISSIIIPIFIVPFFLIVIFVIQMIGAEINEEKTSKSMEIIISSVSPTTHFLSRMITVNIFVVLQAFLFLIYGAIGLIARTMVTGQNLVSSFGAEASTYIDTFISSGMLSELLGQLPLIIVLFLSSFVAYSLLAGILASMTTSIEDFQQLQTPIMLLVMVGYYLAIMASVYENSTFITYFSVIPFISAILAPVLLILGQIGITEIIIAIVLVIITIFLFIKYGLRIYKVGILNYSSSKLWKKMLKAVKEKE